jgi:hypothetical protein
MARSDKGHFAAKHPPGADPGRDLIEAVREAAAPGGLTCESAHALALRHGVAPAIIGQCADRLELRLLACQLGLFGHGTRPKIVAPAAAVAPRVEEALRCAAQSGRITCLDCWRIADQQGLTRLEISGACERLTLRISRCQLGAF